MYIAENNMSEWKSICKAFAKREHAELLFVNDTSMGLEYPNGEMRHIYIDELVDILGE